MNMHAFLYQFEQRGCTYYMADCKARLRLVRTVCNSVVACRNTSEPASGIPCVDTYCKCQCCQQLHNWYHLRFTIKLLVNERSHEEHTTHTGGAKCTRPNGFSDPDLNAVLSSIARCSKVVRSSTAGTLCLQQRIKGAVSALSDNRFLNFRSDAPR
jgi:hypothetical protein